jgi:hypothetical protein
MIDVSFDGPLVQGASLLPFGTGIVRVPKWYREKETVCSYLGTGM